ncbi:MAG: glycosyltransferase family 2 protein [Chitinophagales bacterium]|nr:glycosyltransferase family 2 protein [Chitinophagales bacterium]
MKLSVVVPIYNEEGSVLLLMESLYANLQNYCYELILVDDGSTDATLSIIQQNKNEHTRLLALETNSGQSAALRAGLAQSKHEIIITLDGDMQNNPKDIHALIEQINGSKYSLVQGYRKHRKDGLDKLIPSIVANQLIRFLFSLPVHDIGCSLKAFRREAITTFSFFDGFHRYIPLFVHLNGLEVGEIIVGHNVRQAGISKYGIGRTFSVFKHLLLFRFGNTEKLSNVEYRIKNYF